MPQNRWMMSTQRSMTSQILSLSPLTVLPCSPLEQIDAAQAAGYEAVGIRLHPVMPTDIDVMADRGLMRSIESRLAATNVRVQDVEVFRISPQTDVASWQSTFAFAGALGAKNVLITA